MKNTQIASKKLVSIVATLFMVLFGMMANGCGGGGGGGGTTVEAPGAPINFVVAASAAGGDLSATLSWSAPTTGGPVETYELYKYTSSTSTELNHLISLSADTFQFIDNAGLERGVTTYWLLSAKNAGGETFTMPVQYTPPGGGVGEIDTYGNNFAAAVIFADGYGILGELIDGSWTKETLDPVADIDPKTGMRPTALELDALELAERGFPYFDENTTFLKNDTIYYKQKTISTWQGEWNSTSYPDTQHVTAKWGDNLFSQVFNTASIIRIEMVLSKELDTNMTAYNMVSLYGTKDSEIYGTDGTEYNATTAFVFATNARLTIQELNGDVPGAVVQDINQTLLDSSIPDGPGKFGAEVT